VRGRPPVAPAFFGGDERERPALLLRIPVQEHPGPLQRLATATRASHELEGA
jgi:hypothetical protein